MKIERLQAAIRANPDSADLYRNLGNSHLSDGNLGESLGAYLMALVLAPEDHLNRQNALKLLGMTSGYQVPAQIRNLLVPCASDPDLDTQALASIIHTEFSTGSLADLLVQDLQNLDDTKVRRDLAQGVYNHILEDELLKAVMVNAILITPVVEHMITGLRRIFLEALVENNHELDEFMKGQADFIAALACQCFNTEYVFAVSQEEAEAVERLVSNWSPNISLIAMSILGSYQCLHTLPTIDLADMKAISRCQVSMIRRLLEEPQREAAIAVEIPVLGTVEDRTSRTIQSQYEAFPYPRWTSTTVAHSPVKFAKYVRQRFPLVRSKQVSQGKIDILVAGCGTGRQVVEIATTYKNAQVTAVDLSRTSLAYAKSRADERGLDNIRFMQSDILNLGQLEERFDLVECTGVLHHMADPGAGLAVLKSLLKPTGFLRLALYSYRARAEVRAAAIFIEEQGYDGSAESVRAFRQDVYGMSLNSEIAEVIKTRDFFSLSGLHDYVFNVHEETYTPQGLKDFLDIGGLEFLGFDLPSAEIEKGYREINPSDRFMSDLQAWDRFEAEHPETFGLMFQFWCRPVAMKR